MEEWELAFIALGALRYSDCVVHLHAQDDGILACQHIALGAHQTTSLEATDSVVRKVIISEPVSVYFYPRLLKNIPTV